MTENTDSTDATDATGANEGADEATADTVAGVTDAGAEVALVADAPKPDITPSVKLASDLLYGLLDPLA